MSKTTEQKNTPLPVKTAKEPEVEGDRGKIGDKRGVNYYRIEGSLCHISGKILTIIDASVAEPQQNKALKDLIRNEITQEIRSWQKFFWGDTKGHSVMDMLNQCKNY